MATSIRRTGRKRNKTRQQVDPLDLVFKALANADRRLILDLLKDRALTTGQIAEALPRLDRCTVMQHLRVLESVELVIVQRKGRERWNHLNQVPIQRVYRRWIRAYAEPAVTLLNRLKSDLECVRES